MTSAVVAEARGAVLIVSLDRPESRNAITADMAQAVARHLDRLDESPELRVAVIHGRNGYFSSGMDLKRFERTGERPLDPQRGSGGLAWIPPRKPIIAAVDGYALGLGFEMVLACDLVVAASDAVLGLPEVKHGLVAGGGGAMRLPRRLPRAAAMEMLLTGRPCAAARLHELGLVSRLAAPGEALDMAVALASEVAAMDVDAVVLTKEIALESREWPESEMFAWQEPRLSAFLDARRSAGSRPPDALRHE